MFTRIPDGRAVAATWLAFCCALALALPQPPNAVHVIAGAIVGAGLIVIGFWTASRCRPIPSRSHRQRVKLTALSLLAGALMGFLLLALLIALAQAEPGLRARFADRLSEPAWRPWALAFEASILEEVTFRLVAMSVAAWLLGRFVKRPSSVFMAAVGVSAGLFALAHLPAWIAAGPTPLLVIGAVLLLNGMGGVLLGWIFWRWGLGYAIVCHFAGDVIIQSFGPRLLA